VGVRALNELTLMIELEEPAGYFLHLLALTYALPRHVAQAQGAGWMESGNIVTCGPFRLAAWERGASMVLERDPTYHGRFSGNVQRVRLTFGLERPASLQMYQEDGLELCGLGPAEIDRARQRHVGEYVSAPASSVVFVGFDVTRPPFDDPRVRRAFALATDRETLAGVILRGHVFPASGGLVPPGIPGHSAEIGLPYDPDRACQLLAEAGFPDGRGFPALEALTYSVGDELDFLQAQWRENLSVEFIWEQVEWERFAERLLNDMPHLFRFGAAMPYPDPYCIMQPGARALRDWYHNEAFDELVERARGVTDQEQRLRMFRQAERIVVDEALVVPLWYGRHHWLLKPWVKSYPTAALKWWFWKDVIIEPH
jgi:ABC-type oligopeptide transport system substrate-binding subunit